jgi:hypothetical protein
MKVLTLVRVVETEDGTFGVLLDTGVPFALTLERRWLRNAVGESCIPEGTYTCQRTLSPKFGATFEVTHVPGRTAILFHKGNLQDDTHGCILVGEQFGVLQGKTALLASGPGFEEFLNKLKNEVVFTLRVKEVVIDQ